MLLKLRNNKSALYSIIPLLLLLGLSSSISADDRVLGRWKTIDDKTGKERGLIELYKVNDKLYGKIIDTFAENVDINDPCEKCPGNRYNQPIKDMVFLRDMEFNGDKWSGGYALDVDEGKEYRCIIIIKDKNTLKVRGYIGIPLIGRSQRWYRYLEGNIDIDD